MDEQSKYEMRKRYERQGRRWAERKENEQRKKARLQQQQPAASRAGELSEGVVVRVDRTRLLVRLDGETRDVKPRAGAPMPVVGDRVEIAAGVRLHAIAPRRSVLSRPDPAAPERERVLAANVEVGVVVVAAGVPLQSGLIDRFLIALQRGGIEPLICVNKVDLWSAAERDASRAALEVYRELGHELLFVSAETGENIPALRWSLAERTCVFVGHSGVGKSSLLNALDPAAGQATGAVRDHDGKGRHTTTSAILHTLADGARVIDTPGLRQLGLWARDRGAVRAAFAEFAVFATACRFQDCTHVAEPECGVRAAAEAGDLSAARYRSYLRVLDSLIE